LKEKHNNLKSHFDKESDFNPTRSKHEPDLKESKLGVIKDQLELKYGSESTM